MIQSERADCKSFALASLHVAKVAPHFKMTATLAVIIVAQPFEAVTINEAFEYVNNPTEHPTTS